MDLQERAHRFFRSRARHAAFGGDAEVRRVAARRGDARLGACDAVFGVHQAEKQRGAIAELEIAQRPIERIVAAINRNRHVDISELVRDRLGQRVGEIDHPRRVLRLDKMLGAEIAVAQMQAELDVVGNRGAQPLHAGDNLVVRNIARYRVARLAVPDHHLVADVPLDAEVLVRDVPDQRRDLGDHGFFVSRLDRGQRGGHDNRTDHGKRRRQADLETDIFRQRAVLARGDKVEIGGARLARITELAEFHIRRRDAFGQRQQRKFIGRADGAGRIRPQERAGAQQRILPADPQFAAADFAVGNAAQMRAEHFADGCENLIDRVEADAADQMNFH